MIAARAFRRWALVALALLSAACANIETRNPKDPFEGFNRTVFSFNEGVDTVLFKPLARGYDAVMPQVAQDCVGNVFANLRVPFSAINNVLQGKFKAACDDVARFVVNTTVGLGGCFDVATQLEIPNHREDFGQTLGKWGVPAGPYLVLPLLGSSNVRDTLAQFSPSDRDLVRENISHVQTRNAAIGVRLVDFRASLLKTTDALEKMDVDKYSFIRDAYIARRQNAVYDGDPPDEDAKDGRVSENSSNVNANTKDVKDFKDGVDNVFSTIRKVLR